MMSVPYRDSLETDAPLEIDTSDVIMEHSETPLSINTGGIPEIQESEEDNFERAIGDVVSIEQQQNALSEHVQNVILSDDDDHCDIYKPEGTIYLDVDCFSEFCQGPSGTQNRLSKPLFVRGLPWRILASLRDRRSTPGQPYVSLGFYLQCNGDSKAAGWKCEAAATLTVLSQTDGIEDWTRTIHHAFHARENDWGYNQFVSLNHLANPDNGFIKDDTIKLVIHVEADVPHGYEWDSKKQAGHVGLRNQGATCYMNSLLQTLFFTNKLRKAVYEMPAVLDGADNNVALAMQRVFYDLQHSGRPVETKKLTKSFGWDSVEAFRQHDVQELCRVLLENLENKMKSSPVEDTIPSLFRGRMTSYIKCTDVDFESSRVEDFYDIQLNIMDKNDVMESFRDYIKIERLDGENMYDAGTHGMQPAEKGVKFETFPPVLHLQLMRFQYNKSLKLMMKINDRFEFPDQLNLNEFITNDGENGKDFTYSLHAVLVHSGYFHSGHYVVFINTNLTGPETKAKPRWCKFDDDVVARVSAGNATFANFGGDDTLASAYMLVYVRQSCIGDVLCPMADEDISRHLRVRFKTDGEDEVRRKKEEIETHLYTEVVFVTEQTIMRHHGFDIFGGRQFENELQRERVEKTATVNDLYEYAITKVNSKLHGLRNSSTYDSASVLLPGSIRLWTFAESSCQDGSLTRLRPNHALSRGPPGDHTLGSVLKHERNLLYIEEHDQSLPPYNGEKNMLMFVKYFNAKTNELNIVGHMVMHTQRKLSAYAPRCRRLAQLPDDTPLRFYEEVAPDRISLIENQDIPLYNADALVEENNGIILIFENANETDDEANAKAHLERMFNVVDVEIILNRDSPLLGAMDDKPNLNLQISLDWTCHDLAKHIGEHIHYDPGMILLWWMSRNNKGPISFVESDRYKSSLVRELLGLAWPQAHDPRRGNIYRVFYNKMFIKIAEMEMRIGMDMQIMDDKMHIQLITVFPEKTGTVANILEEARRVFKFAEEGTGKLRLVHVGQSAYSTKVYKVFGEETSVEEISENQSVPTFKCRIEEIPEDQLDVRPNEYLLPVAHFDTSPTRMFGVPFYVKVVQDEPLNSVRERIKKKLDVPEKEFEQYKFALVVHSHVRYLDMESNSLVKLKDLAHTADTAASRLYLGIDHTNKSRGPRSAPNAEKSIVIHN